MSHIFIISQHRTGSTLLKNMLNAHSDVVMAFDEMNLYEYGRKNTLDKVVNSKIFTVEDLIEALRNKEVYGTFWKDFEKSGIKWEELNVALKKEKFSVKHIIKVVLKLLATKHNSSYSGVKYPVHFSKIKKLKEWFPQSKIIFLTRNPKAIIASKLNDPATKKRKGKSLLHRVFVHYFTLLYFAFEYRKSAQCWRKHKNDCFKITYEELVQFQEKALKQICDFCEIEYEEGMISVSGKESSFEQKKLNKPVTDSLTKYKEVLSLFDQWLIDRITIRSYNKFNS